jgi:hypothetical protein
MKRALLIIAALAALWFVTSCSLTNPVTIDECISNFVSDLNGDHASVYRSLSATASEYTQARAALYWDTLFPSSSTYTVGALSTSGSTVTAPFSGGSYNGSTITFTMTQSLNKDYVISAITITAGIVSVDIYK